MRRAIEIRVTAIDEDEHICQGVVTGQVSNFILPSDALSVKITGTGITNAVNLVSTQAVDVVERTWTGSWTVPTDAAGQMLDFQFSGIVADKYCAAHPASKDTDVSLDGYKGRFAVVKVDLDVDANYDGKIDDTDEPLEMNPGGLVCVCTNNLTRIELKLLPADLPGKVTLYSNTSTNHIRIWREKGRDTEIRQPAHVWENIADMPPELWVEGITNSAAARDVELKLEYDETPEGDDSGLFKCEDEIALTVVSCAVNLGIEGVPPSAKMDPGGFICVCTNNLTAITLKTFPEGVTGTATLSLLSWETIINVWSNANRSGKVTMPASWPVANMPEQLYVEGVTNSATVRDVELKLEFVGDKPGPLGEEMRCEDRVKLTVVKIDMITPAGDPVNLPVDGGDGTGSVPDGANEFTFSSATPGVLTLQLKARVTPSGVATQVVKQAHYTVDGIGASAMAWDAANPDGKPTASGDDLLATVRFTGLPEKNSDFGTKKAAVYFDGSKQDEENYEVFYSRNAANNPSSSAPNWFYYWSQTPAGYAHASYTNFQGNYGVTPAMLDWSPTMTYSKMEIWIGDPAAETDTRRDGSGQWVSGIDLFANVVAHERFHTTQIQDADSLLGGLNGRSGSVWVKGWGWNTSRNPAVYRNHFTLGPDGKPGVANVDDDGDGVIDEDNDLSEIGFAGSDDVNLDVDFDDVPDSWQPYDIEKKAGSAETIAEDTYWQVDWGDPGKQHQTIKQYNN